MPAAFSSKKGVLIMEPITELSIDLETYSEEDIKKCGVYKYAESDSFEILLFGVSVNNGPVTVYDLACGDKLPEEIISALADDTIIKWAFNASFERICIMVVFFDYFDRLPDRSCVCVAVKFVKTAMFMKD